MDDEKVKLHEKFESMVPPLVPCGRSDLVDRVDRALASGRSIVRSLEQRTDFKNPELMAWLTEHVGIVQGGTHRNGIGEVDAQSYYEQLTARQDKYHTMIHEEQQQKESSKKKDADLKTLDKRSSRPRERRKDRGRDKRRQHSSSNSSSSDRRHHSKRSRK